MTEWQPGTAYEAISHHLEASNLRVALPAGSALALEVARLVLEPDVRVALVRPSGIDKTTLGYVLTGILAPDSGEVR